MQNGGARPQDDKDTCCYCKEKGHWAYSCPELAKKKCNAESAKKADEEKAAAVTEFAGKASAVSEHEVNSTSSNVFHWNTDTGATSNMTPHRNWIRNYTPYCVPIRLADHRVIYSEGVGTVRFRPIVRGKPYRDVEFTRVLQVPALRNNLLAVLYLTKNKGINVHISHDTMKF